MKYQYFISSRWRNKDQVLDLTNKLRAKGKSVYCFFESPVVTHRLAVDPQLDMQEFEKRDWQTDPYVKEVFDQDIQAEKESGCLVMLLPAGKSSHIEAGVAFGLGRPCILIGEMKEAESLYCIFDQVYPTIDTFINSLV